MEEKTLMPNLDEPSFSLSKAILLVDGELKTYAKSVEVLKNLIINIGMYKEHKILDDLQLTPETSGDFLIGRAYDNVRMLNNLNCKLEDLISSLESMIT